MKSDVLARMLQDAFSLTSRLQPGENKYVGTVTNRFNGLSLRTEAVKTALSPSSILIPRAEATGLMK